MPINTIKNLANFVSIRILNVGKSSPRGSKSMFKKTTLIDREHLTAVIA
jgi:hypothetical protein